MHCMHLYSSCSLSLLETTRPSVVDILKTTHVLVSVVSLQSLQSCTATVSLAHIRYPLCALVVAVMICHNLHLRRMS